MGKDKITINLSDFDNVIVSRDNNCLFILKSSKSDSHICMTPSTEEREAWLVAISSVLKPTMKPISTPTMKPISTRAANGLLLCLNSIVDQDGTKKYQIFRAGGD